MSKEATSNDLPPDDLDDSINLESKVLLALSRLQNTKSASKKPQEERAVSCGNVVRFLKANYSWLDGDILSQVKTVLLSFIKIGIVCILDNSKYRLLVPNSKVMTSACSTRNTHGPQCCCLFTLKCMVNDSVNVCCLLKRSGLQRKKVNAGVKKKTKQKMKSLTRRKQKTKCKLCSKASSIESGKKLGKFKCSYCFKIRVQKPKKHCETCNPCGRASDVPFDIFSPRDEVMET